MVGKKYWVIPDCELPPEGEGRLKGHESAVIVNDGKKDAVIKVTLYFSDRPAHEGIIWKVPAKSVQCFRMNLTEHMSGFVVPLETQYAMSIVSNVPVVIQYGRLDNRQQNLAYYTTMAFSK